MVVKVNGDSMQPKYADGRKILVRRSIEPADIVPGIDCVIVRADQATLKQCVDRRDDMIILGARNKKKYPEPLTVGVGEIQWFGIPVAFWEGIDQEAKRPGK